MDPEELSRVLAYYDTLSDEVAVNEVRHWRVDPERIRIGQAPATIN